jgi:hypothetical protein
LSSLVEFIDTGFNTKFLENLELLRRQHRKWKRWSYVPKSWKEKGCVEPRAKINDQM